MTYPSVYHPRPRRDRGRSYYGATWATAQAQSTPVARIRRWVRRAWGRFVMRAYHAARWLMLAALGAAAVALVIAAGGGR